MSKRKLTGSKYIQMTVDKVNVIRNQLQTTQDREKSYADRKRKDLKFEIRDWIFLKLSSKRGVVCFRKYGN